MLDDACDINKFVKIVLDNKRISVILNACRLLGELEYPIQHG